jgi:hypothetical protein
MPFHLTPAEAIAISNKPRKISAADEAIINLGATRQPIFAQLPITFDRHGSAVLNDGDIVDTTFAGVTFSSFSGGHVYARKPLFGTAHSGNNVASTTPKPPQPQDCSVGEPDGIKAVFATPQRKVCVWACPLQLPEGGLGPTSGDQPYLRAYDANQQWLGEASCSYPDNPPAIPEWFQLIFESSSANIASIHMSVTVDQGGLPVVAYFDDFTFSS